MRWPHFILLQCLLVMIVAGIVYFHKDRVILIKSPPASLAQWYKPENKQQVWLQYLRHLHGLSDDVAVMRRVQTPCWQYFCGEEYLQHQLPIDPVSPDSR